MATATLRRVFTVRALEKLIALLETQADAALGRSGVEFPARTTPIVLLLAQRGPLSAADVARELAEAHQLVTQRINLLLDLKIVSRVADPHDARRKLLRITPRGKKQLTLLSVGLEEAEAVFAVLFEEVGVDLETVAMQMIEALQRQSFLERQLAVSRPRAR